MKKMKTFEYVISTAVGAFFSFFGVLAIPLALLIPCNIIDYFTGMAASKVHGDKITSHRSWIGIVKKITMYVLIFVGFGIDCMISYVTATLHVEMKFPLLFAAIVASWLVINELISITENCEAIGHTVPILGPVLKFVKKKIETTVEVDTDHSEGE
ncbi:MAG: phage holin family protein [Clostridiales bacterium]|nr:phage holin family protein [Clostridiales bacterium]